MPVRRDLPRVLECSAARRLGISDDAVRHAVRAHGWQRLLRGVLLTAPDEPTRSDWAAAGLAFAGPGAALSGWDAARQRGLGDRRPPDPRVLVLTVRGRHFDHPQVLVRRTTRPFASSTLSGEDPSLPYAPVVATPRAVADTALMHRTLAPVRALVSAAVQRELCRPDELVAEVARCPRNHSALFRRAVADVVDGARSVAEAEAADALRRRRVPEFELNVPVIDTSGRVVAVLDVLWRDLRAVLEIDSREHHFAEPDWRRTMRRHNLLTAAGLAVAHHPPAEIRAAPQRWSACVATWLRARASELGVPYRPAGERHTATVPEPRPVRLPGASR